MTELSLFFLVRLDALSMFEVVTTAHGFGGSGAKDEPKERREREKRVGAGR